MKTALLLVPELHVISNLQECLRRFSYRSETVSTPAAAVQQVQQLVPDLLIVDATMPRVNPSELIRALRAAQQERVSYAVVLDQAGSTGANRHFRAGADLCFTKPLNFIDFIRFVRRMGEDGDGGAEVGAAQRPAPPPRRAAEAQKLPE